MARPIKELEITSEHGKALLEAVNRASVPKLENRRAWIILDRANGLSQEETARKVGVSRPVVVHWEQRFRKQGFAGLTDANGRGRKPTIAPEVFEKVIVKATQPPRHRPRL